MIKLNYRPEIDGLRAIAVLAVIFYHVEFYFNDLKLFSGGFIGVDIFFVISGYLITSIIIKEIKQNNRFSLVSFYMRRARRILPALFFTIFISIFFAWHFLIPSSFIQFSNSIISSIFFFSNYFFYFEGLVYNSDQSLLKPLLHTWSLSVEEQFYIFFPIILIFVNKFFKEKLLFVFFLLFFLSFIVAFYTSMNNLSFSFFSTLSRGWEFLAGSFLAYLEINKEKLYYKNHNLFTVAGFFLIIYSLITFDNSTVHPSIKTLLPVSGVFLIIFFSNTKNFITRFLSNYFFVKVGLISYSLYLWHFPVFAFARNKTDTLSDFDKIELLIITIFLSILSYLFIEKPFRKKNLISSKFVTAYFSIFIFFFITFNILSNNKNGFDNRIHVFLKKTEREILEYSMSDEWGSCFDRFENFCNYNNTAKKSIILIGDSHLEVLSQDLYKKIDSENVNFISINRGTCIYLPDTKKFHLNTQKEFSNCTIKSKKLIDKIISNKESPIIILAGNYFEHFYKNDNWNYANESNLEPIDSFIKSINELLLNNNKVLLIYPIPSPGFHVVKRLMHEIPKSTFNASEYLINNPLTFDMDDYYSKNLKIINKFDNLNHKNLIKIFPDKIFCNIDKMQCNAHKGSDIYFRDQQHLAASGVELLNQKIFFEIEKIIKE